MNRSFPPAHLWLGRTFQEQGRFDDALAEFRQVEEVLGDWPVAIAARGFVAAAGTPIRLPLKAGSGTTAHAIPRRRWIYARGTPGLDRRAGDPCSTGYAASQQRRDHYHPWSQANGCRFTGTTAP